MSELHEIWKCIMDVNMGVKSDSSRYQNLSQRDNSMKCQRIRVQHFCLTIIKRCHHVVITSDDATSLTSKRIHLANFIFSFWDLWKKLSYKKTDLQRASERVGKTN
jgi:hypothetical protein